MMRQVYCVKDRTRPEDDREMFGLRYYSKMAAEDARNMLNKNFYKRIERLGVGGDELKKYYVSAVDGPIFTD